MSALRLRLHPVSAVVVRLVAIRGVKVAAALATWTPLRGWSFEAAGCAAARLQRVLPTVIARAERERGEAWRCEGAALGLHRANGCRQMPKVASGV